MRVLSEVAMPETESEFGKGLCYCLGLFLAHAERVKELKDVYKKSRLTDWPESWFNGASDHLYELVIPDDLPQDLKTRLTILQGKCLDWGHGFGVDKPAATDADVQWSIDEAKELLRLIDQWHGIAVVKGQWE